MGRAGEAKRSGVLIAVAVLVFVARTHQSMAAGFSPDPVFPIGPISATVNHQIAKLDQVASTLAGRNAVVNCWTQRDWLRFQEWQATHHERRLVDAYAVTYPTHHRIQLSPFICQVLAQTLAHAARQPLFAAWAITVFAHESAHVSGISAESRAECRAIRTEPHAAELFGFSRRTARAFQHIYRGTIYPRDQRRYRVPACAAGRPGVVMPDTLGSPTELRPLRRIAQAIARHLPAWKDIGGDGYLGPLSPCGYVKTRAEEAARFNDSLLGPHHAGVTFGATILHTTQEVKTALYRLQKIARCSLNLAQAQLRDLHLKGNVTAGRLPSAITRLSPSVHAFREVETLGGKKWDWDTVSIFDRKRRMITLLRFTALAGQITARVESGAIAAADTASRVGG